MVQNSDAPFNDHLRNSSLLLLIAVDKITELCTQEVVTVSNGLEWSIDLCSTSLESRTAENWVLCWVILFYFEGTIKLKYTIVS